MVVQVPTPVVPAVVVQQVPVQAPELVQLFLLEVVDTVEVAVVEVMQKTLENMTKIALKWLLQAQKVSFDFVLPDFVLFYCCLFTLLILHQDIVFETEKNLAFLPFFKMLYFNCYLF